MKKSLILTSRTEKFSSGRLLKRRAVSDGPLRGGLNASKIHVIVENTFPFSTVLVPVQHKPTLNHYSTGVSAGVSARKKFVIECGGIRGVTRSDPKMGISQEITFKEGTYHVVYLQTGRFTKLLCFFSISQFFHYILIVFFKFDYTSNQDYNINPGLVDTCSSYVIWY